MLSGAFPPVPPVLAPNYQEDSVVFSVSGVPAPTTIRGDLDSDGITSHVGAMT